MSLLRIVPGHESCCVWNTNRDTHHVPVPTELCHEPVDHSEDGSFYHHVMLELVEVEQLPPVWADGEIREKMSKRFKIEGNEKFTVGDYTRSATVGG